MSTARRERPRVSPEDAKPVRWADTARFVPVRPGTSRVVRARATTRRGGRPRNAPTPRIETGRITRDALPAREPLSVESSSAWASSEADALITDALVTEALVVVPDTPRPAGPVTPVVGASLGPYRLTGELGRGGMGIVFRARREPWGEAVALKILRDPDRTSLVERFLRETEAVARLEHPNIVRIVDAGRAGELPYFVMELVDGAPLSHLLAEGPLAPRHAVALVRDVARAVDYAHERGVVHRDLKPGNVLVAADGTPKVSDFGLAKLDDDRRKLTRTGSPVGTPAYVSPEQALGGAVDRRTDVFSLGLILYEAVTGRLPWTGDLALDASSDEIALPPLESGDADLERIVRKCTEKLPRDRYESAEALARDLDAWLAGESPLARAPRWARWARRLGRRSGELVLAGAAGATLVLVPIVTWLRSQDVTPALASSIPVARARASVAPPRRAPALVAAAPSGPGPAATTAALLAPVSSSRALEDALARDERALEDAILAARSDLLVLDARSAESRIFQFLGAAPRREGTRARAETALAELRGEVRLSLDAACKHARMRIGDDPGIAAGDARLLRRWKLQPPLEQERDALAAELDRAVERAYASREAAARVLANASIDGASARAQVAPRSAALDAAHEDRELARVRAGRARLVAAFQARPRLLAPGLDATVESFDESALSLTIRPRGSPTLRKLALSQVPASALAAIVPGERGVVAHYLTARGLIALGHGLQTAR